MQATDKMTEYRGLAHRLPYTSAYDYGLYSNERAQFAAGWGLSTPPEQHPAAGRRGFGKFWPVEVAGVWRLEKCVGDSGRKNC
jgi:hypothetical protein